MESGNNFQTNFSVFHKSLPIGNTISSFTVLHEPKVITESKYRTSFNVRHKIKYEPILLTPLYTSHKTLPSGDKISEFSALYSFHIITITKDQVNFTARHKIYDEPELLTHFSLNHKTLPIGSVYSNFSVTHDFREIVVYRDNTNFTVTFDNIDRTTEIIAYHSTKALGDYSLNSYIDIHRPFDMPSSISVRTDVCGDMESIIQPRLYRDLKSEITVSKLEQDELYSEIGIRTNTKLDNNIHIIGVDDSDLLSSIFSKYRGNSEIKWSIRIRSPYKRIEDGRIGKDYKSSIDIMATDRSYLSSKLGVTLGTRLENTIRIDAYGESNLISSINVKWTNDLVGEIRVSPLNLMTGIVDVEPPVRLIKTFNPIQDTYVRSGVPRLSYGDNEMLATGYGAGRSEIFRSLLRFDVSEYVNLPSGFELDSAKLILHYAFDVPKSDLKLSYADSNWDEFSTTWNNKPEEGSDIQTGYTLDTINKTVEFNITDLIQNSDDNNITSIDFYLKNVDESKTVNYFYSRELEGYEPKIEIKYLDTNISNQGRGNLDSYIFPMYRGNYDGFRGSVEVKGYWADFDRDSSITVTPSGWRHESLLSSIIVTGDERQGSIVIRQDEDFDMPSEVGIRWTEMDFIDASILISQVYLDSYIYVLNRYDVPSTIVSRASSFSRIPSFIYVIPYEDFPGSIDVYYFNVIPSFINVKQQEASDIDIILYVSKPDLPSSIYVKPYVSLMSEIAVRRTVKDGGIESRLSVSRSNNDGSIYVTPYFDFRGSIKARRTVKDGGIESTLQTSVPNMLSLIYVRPYVSLMSEIAVRRTVKDGGIESILRISRGKIDSSVYVIPYIDFNGSISVRRREKHLMDSRFRVSRPTLPSTIQAKIINNLPSTISVRRDGWFDLESSFYTLHRSDLPVRFDIIGASKLPSSIYSNSPYLGSKIKVRRDDYSSIIGSITAKQFGDSDLSSIIQAKIFYNMEGRIIINRYGDSEIDGSIISRQNVDFDIDSSIDVFNVSDLDSSIAIRRVGRTDEPSIVYILNRNEITGRIKVGGWEDLGGSIYVVLPFQSDLIGYILPRVPWAYDMYTEMFVVNRGNHDMYSEMQIAPTNKMTGIIDIMPPTLVVDPFYPVRDAYIRSGIPRLNYGFAQVLTAGYQASKNEILRTVLGFDISQLPLGQTIRKAVLKLKFTTIPEGTYSLNETSEIWTELGVTWMNQPKNLSEMSGEFTINSEDNTMDFDLTEYIKDKYDSGEDILDFVIKAIDETVDNYDIFFSKESNDPPRLEISYFPTEIPSFGKSNIDSSIDVKYRGNYQLAGRIEVFAILDEYQIPSSIEILPVGDKDTQSRIVISHPNLEGSTFVKYRKDIPSSITIQEFGNLELDSKITVKRDNLLSKINIITGFDTPSNITVRVPKDAKLVSFITVKRDNLYSEIIVPYRLDIPSSAIVRQEFSNAIPSLLNVSRDNITGIIQLRPHSEIKGYISARREVEEYIPSSIEVFRDNLVGEIYVLNRSDINSSIGVPFDAYEELKAYITISCPDLLGSIYVLNRSDIPTRLAVRRDKFDTIEISFTISKPTLPSQFKVLDRYDMPSTIGVRGWAYWKQDSVVAISRPNLPSQFEVLDRDDVNGSISVRQTVNTGGMESILRISNPEIKASIDILYRYDMDGSITVRRTVDKEGILTNIIVSRPDLLSTIKVNGYDLIPSSITARREVEEEGIPSWFTVSRPDLLSKIKVNGYYLIPSSITARREVEEEGIPSWFVINQPDLLSKIKVNGYYLIPSTIFARQEVEEEGIPSWFTVSRPDLLSTIKINGYDLIPSSITVRQEVEEEGITSSVGISRHSLPANFGVRVWMIHDIPTSLEVHEWVEIPSSISIRVWDWHDLPSSIHVRVDEETDIKTSIGVRVNARETYESKLRISNPQFEGSVTVPPYSLILSKIKVINSDLLDMPSRIGVTFNNRLENDIEIIGVGNFDIPSELRVSPAYNVPGYIAVVYYGDHEQPSLIGVRGKEKYDMPSKLFVFLVGEDDLDGSVGVRPVNKMTGDIFIIPVDDSDLPTSIVVHEISEIPSSITARQTKVSEIPSSINAKQINEIPSSITAHQVSNINGIIYVLQHMDIPSSITAHQISEIEGSISVRRTVEDDYDSSIYVLYRNDIPSSIEAHHHYNMDGSISVRRTVEDDYDSSIYVLYRNDIPSSIEAHHFLDMPSSISARRSDKSEREGSIYVLNRRDLFSSIEVHHFLDIPSSISARQSDENDIDGSIYILYRSDLEGSIEVHHFLDIPSSISARQSGKSVIGGSIYVLHRSDIPSRIDVWEKLLIPGSITARQTKESDIDGTIYVLHRSDIPSWIEAHHHYNVDGSIYILYHSEFEGVIDVITSYPYAFIM
jgi:hypothetical protein